MLRFSQGTQARSARLGVSAVVAMLIGGMIILGCGKAGKTPTYPVRGVVTYQGKPLAGVTVGFTPENGRAATGVTDASGQFTLSTFESKDGAVAGKHKVTIGEGPHNEPPPMPGMPGYDNSSQGEPRFPPQYSDVRQTPLELTVEADGENEFTIELSE